MVSRRLASTTARGYGHSHQKLRAEYQRRMDRGEQFTCWRCGGWVNPALPWDLGHDDHDRTRYRGPEHRGKECPAGGNRATQRPSRRQQRAFRRWVL